MGLLIAGRRNGFSEAVLRLGRAGWNDLFGGAFRPKHSLGGLVPLAGAVANADCPVVPLIECNKKTAGKLALHHVWAALAPRFLFKITNTNRCPMSENQQFFQDTHH